MAADVARACQHIRPTRKVNLTIFINFDHFIPLSRLGAEGDCRTPQVHSLRSAGSVGEKGPSPRATSNRCTQDDKTIHVAMPTLDPAHSGQRRAQRPPQLQRASQDGSDDDTRATTAEIDIVAGPKDA